LRIFRIVERGDVELLKKALPHQLEKILNMLENLFISWNTAIDQEETLSSRWELSRKTLLNKRGRTKASKILLRQRESETKAERERQVELEKRLAEKRRG